MASPSALSQAETSITGGVATLSNLLNASAGPTAIAGFVAEGIFKAIKLGVAMRGAQREANDSLDAAVRAADVVRSPVIVKLDRLEVQTFYGNEMNFAAFDGFNQFTPEIEELRRTGGNPSAKTLRTLEIAMNIVPALQDDPDLTDHPELSNIFRIGFDPTRQSAREMVLAYLGLFPDGPLPYRTHYDRLGGFWKNQIAIALDGIDQAQVDAQADLSETIEGLVRDAIFDSSGGLLTSTLNLTKKLKVDSIAAHIDELTQEKQSTGASEKADIQAKINALTQWKTRLA